MKKATKVKDLHGINNLKTFIRRSKGRGSATKKIGVLSSKVDEPHPNNRGATIGEVALLMRTGFTTKDGVFIPPRDFISVASQLAENDIRRARRKFAKRLKANNPPSVQELAQELAEIQYERLLEVFVNSSLFFPGNKPSTVDRKGFDHPLIETHTLLDSLGIEDG